MRTALRIGYAVGKNLNKLLVLLSFAIGTLSVDSLGADVEPNPDEVNAYRSYQAIVSHLTELERNHSDIMDLITIGSSHGDDGNVDQAGDNREIFAVKISDFVNSSDDSGMESEPDVLFVGGQHAREWIAVEVPVSLIEYLVESYSRDQSIRDLIDHSEIWIVPLVNPDGYEHSRKIDRMWRKNMRFNSDGSRGVDLNRNFPYPLGVKWTDGLPIGTFTSIDPAFETYRGSAPFSEPETRAVQQLVLQNNFKLAISFHNFGQTILYPWGIESEPTKDARLLEQIANTFSNEIRKVGGPEYRATQSYNPFNSAGGAYLKHGEISDWLYDIGILAFTVEIRPESHRNGGFILPIDQIDEVIQEMLAVSRYAIRYSIDRLSSPIDFGTPDVVSTLAEVFDRNQNGFVDDDELFEIVDYWVSGERVFGTGVFVTNEIFFELLEKWTREEFLFDAQAFIKNNLAIRNTSIISRSNHFRLDVHGVGIEQIDLQVYNLAGKELLSTSQNGSRVQFRLFNESGDGLANGTYLYMVTAKGADGRTESTAVEKFVLLR